MNTYIDVWDQKSQGYRRIPQLECVHLGLDTGEQASCLVCKGAQLKVFECDLHGRCTKLKPARGIQTCHGCPDKQLEKTNACN